MLISGNTENVKEQIIILLNHLQTRSISLDVRFLSNESQDLVLFSQSQPFNPLTQEDLNSLDSNLYLLDSDIYNIFLSTKLTPLITTQDDNTKSFNNNTQTVPLYIEEFPSQIQAIKDPCALAFKQIADNCYVAYFRTVMSTQSDDTYTVNHEYLANASLV